VDNVTLAIRTIDVAQVRAIAAAIAGARRTVVIASGSFLGRRTTWCTAPDSWAWTWNSASEAAPPWSTR